MRAGRLWPALAAVLVLGAACASDDGDSRFSSARGMRRGRHRAGGGSPLECGARERVPMLRLPSSIVKTATLELRDTG